MPAYSVHAILHQHDIFSIIFEDIPLSDLSRIRGTHPALRTHVEQFITALIRRNLAPFVGKHTNAFLRELDERESVLSGSVILKLILHGTIHGNWTPNDGDIYCPLTTANALIRFLTHTVGFTAVWPEPFLGEAFPEYIGGITAVVHLHHSAHKPLDVIISAQMTPHWPIAHFWNTFVMNYVSGKKLSIAYPLTTPCGRGQSLTITSSPPASTKRDFPGMVNPSVDDTTKTAACIDKYNNRLIKTVPFGHISTPHTRQGRYKSYCSASFRHFGDPACLEFDISTHSTTSNDNANDDTLTAFPDVRPFWSHGALACCRGCAGSLSPVYGLASLDY